MMTMIRLAQLLFCLLLFSGCGKPLDLDSALVFQEAERTFSQAKSPEDYLKAAAMYQEILDRGYCLRRGAL